MPKKIAVIGLGYWGSNLVRNFKELGALKAVCDSNAENLEKIAQKHQITKKFHDVKDVFASPDINAVVIATPAATHHQLCLEAISAGKDVFVEKPVSLTLPQAEDLASCLGSSQKIFMVDHLLLYHPAVLKLKEIIDNGKLGKLQYIYSNRLNIGKLRNEENILWSFAPHDISVILHLTGRAPAMVRAFGEAYVQERVYDTTVTDLTFSDKLKAHIFVSWLHPFKEQKLVAIGNYGMAVFNDLEEEAKLTFYPHRVEWIKQIPVANKAEKEVIAVDKKEPLKEACRHFLDCLETRKNPVTDINEAMSVLDVLEKAQKDLEGAA